MALRDIEWEYGARRFINLGHRPASVTKGTGTLIETQAEFDALTITSGANITLADTFYGSLTVDQPNVTITGGGLKGSQEVQGESWTDEGGGIYSLTTSEVKWLYIDGQTAVLANTGFVNLVSLPTSNTFTIADNSLTNVGAYAVERNRPWSYTRGIKVTNYSSGTVTLEYDHGSSDRSWNTSGTAYLAGTDGKVNLYGLQEYITDNYDWAYEGGKLYVKLPSAPSNYTIHAVYNDYGINVTGNNCTINNVEISHCFLAGIRLAADTLDVDDCTIHHIREDGIRVPSIQTGIDIDNCSIYNCDVRGISLSNVSTFNIRSNSIYNIGVNGNDGWLKDSYETHHFALNCISMAFTSYQYTGDGSTDPYTTGFEISKNELYNSAYCGIHQIRADDGLITKNYIHDVLKVMEDGGGIYNAFQTQYYPLRLGGVEISYNIIESITDNYWDVKRCLYFDHMSGANNVHHNICYNNDASNIMKVNTGSIGYVIEDNIFVGSAQNVLNIDGAANATYSGPAAADIELNRNTFVILSETLECLDIDLDIFSTSGGSDYNKFFTPYAANKVADNNLSLATWRTTYGTDANSVVTENYLTYVDAATALDENIVYSNPTDSDTQVTAPYYYYDDGGNDIGGTLLTIPSWFGKVIFWKKTISNTHEMVVDAAGEGVSVLNNDMYASDGAGTDAAVSFEFWVTSHSSLTGVQKYLELLDDNDDSLVMQVLKSSAHKIAARALNTVSHYITAVGDSIITTSTLYHIVVTYDGSEAWTGFNIYIDSVAETPTQSDIGSYAGMPALVGTLKANIGVNSGYGKYQLFRQFNKELSQTEVTFLYNGGSPISLRNSLQQYCVQENLFNNSPNADHFGNNGTNQGTVTYTSL